MPRLVIDNINVEVDSGTTVLDAAKKLGIEIPTMCFLKEYKALTSCMICVVKIEGIESLMPACGTIATDGMKVETSMWISLCAVTINYTMLWAILAADGNGHSFKINIAVSNTGVNPISDPNNAPRP